MNIDWDVQALADNTAGDWILAGSTFVVVLVVLLILRWGMVRFTERGPQQGAATPLRSFAASIQRQSSVPVIFLVALFAGLLNLELPGFLERGLNVAIVAVVFIQIGLWGRAALTFLVRRRLESDPDFASPGAIAAARYLVTLLLWSILAVLFLDNIGVEITTLVAGLGVGGIAIGLAARSILSDLFASLAILLDRPFAVGDFVSVKGAAGSVERIGIKTTHLRSPTGEQLVYSNSDMLGSPLRNFGRMNRRRAVLSLNITFDTAAEQIEAIPGMIKEAVERHPEARFDRAHFKGFGESALQIEAVYYMATTNFAVFMDTQQAINLELLDRFRAAGIEFAFPTRAVHIAGELPTAGD